MIDLYRGRRTEYIECRYWSVDDNEVIPSDRIVYERQETGMFYAKETNLYNEKTQIVGDSFLIYQKSITLLTKDWVDDLKINDIVKFDDVIYRVEDIQKEPIKKHKQYMIESSYNTYISLRG